MKNSCRVKYQNIAGFLFCCCIHTIQVWLVHVHSCVLHALLHSICAYISACVCMYQCTSDLCMLHLMFTSCGLALSFVWALPHLIPVSALGSSPFEGFIPAADPEDLCRFFQIVCWGHPHSPAAVPLTQHGMCYSSHVVMSCQKQP